MAPQRLTWKWRVIAAIVITLVNVARWRVNVEGLEHVPRRSGAVLAFNHHSYLDFLMVAWAPVRQLKRPVRFLAKREIWQSRWVGWVVRWGEAVPVDRTSATARAGAFDAAAEALAGGDLVAVAPEQTISRSLELLPLRTGAVRMAQQAGAPIVPVIGWGSHRALTKGQPKRLALGLPVTVRFGAPLEVGAEEDPVEATDRLREVMERMLDEVQHDYPDGLPAGERWVPARFGGAAPDHEEVLRQERERSRTWNREGDRPTPTEAREGDRSAPEAREGDRPAPEAQHGDRDGRGTDAAGDHGREGTDAAGDRGREGTGGARGTGSTAS